PADAIRRTRFFAEFLVSPLRGCQIRSRMREGHSAIDQLSSFREIHAKCFYSISDSLPMWPLRSVVRTKQLICAIDLVRPLNSFYLHNCFSVSLPHELSSAPQYPCPIFRSGGMPQGFSEYDCHLLPVEVSE